MPSDSAYSFAFYCSGHGYGHATRVSALTSHLLSLHPPPTVHIVSSAPKHVFSDSVALGALYRYAEIDPVIVQPLAYRVDRQKSIRALRSFLDQKDQKVDEESRWLQDIKADCVLSDAAFLGFLAANKAQLPSILVTNFTFDSVYSYLSASFVDQSRSRQHHSGSLTSHMETEPDIPVPAEELDPLVSQIYDGYRHADLLLRLPGAIPIPAFATKPQLPATDWIDSATGTFHIPIISHLTEDPAAYTLHPSVPFPSIAFKPKARAALSAPLLVRLPSHDIYTPAGRSRVLDCIGVPTQLHDPSTTKILVVSFGGQVINRPGHSRTSSRLGSGTITPSGMENHSQPSGDSFPTTLRQSLTALDLTGKKHPAARHPLRIPRISTPSHIYIPGAPSPASKATMASSSSSPVFQTIPPTPTLVQDGFQSNAAVIEPEGQFVPDDSWIVIVCGVSESKGWHARGRTLDSDDLSGPNIVSGPGDGCEEDELPEGFYIAPKNIYMPDLMAIGDVLLGKLGYGTVSECVESCTPFVYVSRPLFVEEHGLRILLSREGVGVEMDHEEYEAGNWAGKVAEAWQKGSKRKLERRNGQHAEDRKKQGTEMAKFIVEWTRRWAQQPQDME